MADTFYSRKPEADASALELNERAALLSIQRFRACPEINFLGESVVKTVSSLIHG